ncbi:uncharacterized protein PSFLO_05366 [Pseudozyma flocculosa]|uniref:Uncharacterized protein n=1 Tax=Pseudozyma flocculosa TaxID=84751 RepID=A0A5C3F899_9BASI|nr:uncharacterized protein PSFLO_05366 [Pseudozyma flocculosa]
MLLPRAVFSKAHFEALQACINTWQDVRVELHGDNVQHFGWQHATILGVQRAFQPAAVQVIEELAALRLFLLSTADQQALHRPFCFNAEVDAMLCGWRGSKLIDEEQRKGTLESCAPEKGRQADSRSREPTRARQMLVFKATSARLSLLKFQWPQGQQYRRKVTISALRIGVTNLAEPDIPALQMSPHNVVTLDNIPSVDQIERASKLQFILKNSWPPFGKEQISWLPIFRLLCLAVVHEGRNDNYAEEFISQHCIKQANLECSSQVHCPFAYRATSRCGSPLSATRTALFMLMEADGWATILAQMEAARYIAGPNSWC